MTEGLSPAALVSSRRIVVCVGSGGVGKTTLAATLALGAARRGRRVLVLTIDPARRLADALGVKIEGNQPHAIPRATLDTLGVPPEGEMHAMMLDMKRTFDDLVTRFADSPATRDRILGNRIYQHVSDALAGSAEYSAMEKVYELSESKDFDLIVVDTPPTQHAIDFLEAPARLVEFLDSRIVKLLLHPAFSAGRLGFRVFQRSATRVLTLIERVSGIGFLEDISEFLLAFEGMSEGFRERAHAVRALLIGEASGFVLAAGPASESVAHAETFLTRLSAVPVRVAGIVVNRVRLWPGGGAAPERIPSGDDEAGPEGALAARLAESLGPEFPAAVGAGARLAAVPPYASLVRRDARATAGLKERAARGNLFWRCVPELERDVHDLEGLARVAAFVFEDGGARP